MGLETHAWEPLLSILFWKYDYESDKSFFYQCESKLIYVTLQIKNKQTKKKHKNTPQKTLSKENGSQILKKENYS